MMITTLQLEPKIHLSEEQFYDLCRQNPELKFERSPNGELMIMPPTGGETGRKNAEIIADFILWNRQYNFGVVFDSSTCFRLPQGSNRSPDVAWVKKERWEALTSAQREKFPPLCPDFVLELLSPTDQRSVTQRKMEEYLANGSQLGWLINPSTQQVEIYRPRQPVKTLQAPSLLSGENVLPEFTLTVDWLWQS